MGDCCGQGWQAVPLVVFPLPAVQRIHSWAESFLGGRASWEAFSGIVSVQQLRMEMLRLLLEVLFPQDKRQDFGGGGIHV